MTSGGPPPPGLLRKPLASEPAALGGARTEPELRDPRWQGPGWPRQLETRLPAEVPRYRPGEPSPPNILTKDTPGFHRLPRQEQPQTPRKDPRASFSFASREGEVQSRAWRGRCDPGRAEKGASPPGPTWPQTASPSDLHSAAPALPSDSPWGPGEGPRRQTRSRETAVTPPPALGRGPLPTRSMSSHALSFYTRAKRRAHWPQGKPPCHPQALPIGGLRRWHRGWGHQHVVAAKGTSCVTLSKSLNFRFPPNAHVRNTLIWKAEGPDRYDALAGVRRRPPRPPPRHSKRIPLTPRGPISVPHQQLTGSARGS